MIGFSAEKVLDFACGRVNTMMIMKDTSDAKETVPGQSGIHGLTHAYKKEDKWHFVSESDKDYEASKQGLPPLSFAFRKQIMNAEVLDKLPGIEELLKSLEFVDTA